MLIDCDAVYKLISKVIKNIKREGFSLTKVNIIKIYLMCRKMFVCCHLNSKLW